MSKEILEEVARETGLTLKALKDKKESYHVLVNPDVKLTLTHLNPGIRLYALVAKIPEQNREELLMHMMEANFLYQGTGGNVLGVDQNEKRFTIRFTSLETVSKEALHDYLERFVNYLLYWRAKIQASR